MVRVGAHLHRCIILLNTNGRNTPPLNACTCCSTQEVRYGRCPKIVAGKFVMSVFVATAKIGDEKPSPGFPMYPWQTHENSNTWITKTQKQEYTPLPAYAPWARWSVSRTRGTACTEHIIYQVDYRVGSVVPLQKKSWSMWKLQTINDRSFIDIRRITHRISSGWDQGFSNVSSNDFQL